ncbi:uncharacterized protein RJT20DRAFT_116820 [Scheffersomyces xylosifermentans]|uniref:uncharacterized protein n=1 Tax=Scheffersomyces xylosifermentans TaxID=1304137 RepID=UPI00315DCE4E
MPVAQPPFKVRTKVSWAGEEEGDLGFLENEIIEVFSIVDESWWSGKLRRNKAEGIFPKDYVVILEEKPLNHSSSNVSLATPQPNTPIKDDHDNRFRNSKGNTPVGYFVSSKSTSPKRTSHPLNDPSQSYDDDDYNYDVSYENIMMTKSKQKVRSPNKLVSSKNHPKHRSSFQQQQQQQEEFFGTDREREIENFKMLQQQQNYHIKKQPEQSKRLSLQQDMSRYAQVSPDGYNQNYNSSFQSKSKSSSRPASQLNIAQELYDPNSPSSKHAYKSQSYTDLPHQQQNGRMQPLFNNYTVESFSPQASPSAAHNRRNRAMYDTEAFDEYEQIAQKRAQLEMELSQLRQLEKSTQQKRGGSPPKKESSPTHAVSKANRSNDYNYDPSIESSYVSEDLLSSKKNYSSREDLGKKLSQYATDEDAEDDNLYVRQAVDDFEYDSPPPPPPKHTTPVKARNPAREDLSIQQEGTNGRLNLAKRAAFDADDFKFSTNSEALAGLSDEDIYRLSQLQQEDLKNSIKSLQSDVLNLSELSATSAGSFSRHKYEREMQQQELRMSGLAIHEEEGGDKDSASPKHDSKQIMDSIFQEKKSRHPNIFKKLLSKKSGDEINVIEKKLQKEEEIDWATFKSELNRMNSLTSQDKQGRTRRVVREEGSLIVKPLDYISEINCNETVGNLEGPALDVTQIAFRKVNAFMENYDTSSDLNELISDISVKFNSSKLNQIRCVLLHLCKFRIVEESTTISQTKPKLNEVLHMGEASIYQINYLFKKILDALRIPSEVVLGFWKKPNEFYHNEQYVINHCWISILVENHFFIMDLYNFKNGSVCNIQEDAQGFNEFYFLAEPLSVVSTHIPSVIDLQHVLPPIDPNIAFYLPRSYSGFYRNNLKFRNFNNALTRLKDLEFFELDLEIPTDVELFTLIKTSKVTTNELSLCQVQWINNKRTARIKAILPENESIGVLQIFAGPKGLQKHFDNIHELAIVIPLYHSGSYKSSKFVPRFPTVQSQNNDLYVKQPQTSKIIVKNAYNFEVEQYPSQGLTSGSGLMNQGFKIVVESPSGKYFKLNQEDPSKPYGTYFANIKCQELGLYRGLVIGDSGNSWYVFTQWDCIQGTVMN